MKSEVNWIENWCPWDKSWVIRMGILDIIHGKSDGRVFLEANKEILSDDLLSLLRAMQDWEACKGKETGTIYVGESATLYRFLMFATWKMGIKREFVRTGTLVDRQITTNPEILNWSLERLKTLDGGTSQWVSAAMLWLKKEELIQGFEYKNHVTHEAMTHWHEARNHNRRWSYRFDETIRNQYEAFLDILEGRKTLFTPEQREDYCFARVFGWTDQQEAIRRGWGSLRNHETNRLEEMEIILFDYERGEPIESRDHRGIQAIVMKSLVDKRKIIIRYPEAVSKSWPGFFKIKPFCDVSFT